MHTWKILKGRYSSNEKYRDRKVIRSPSDLEEFKDFIINSCNCQILSRDFENEAFRFKRGKDIGIVYSRGGGNLLAHDLGMKYDSSIPPDYNVKQHFHLGNPPKRKAAPSKAKKKNRNFIARNKINGLLTNDQVCQIAEQYCLENDKSVGFQLQYTADLLMDMNPGIDFDIAHEIASNYLLGEYQV